MRSNHGNCDDDRAEPEASEGLQCPKCQYNLTGLREHRCPECGCAFDPVALLRAAGEVKRIPWLNLLILGVIVGSGIGVALWSILEATLGSVHPAVAFLTAPVILLYVHGILPSPLKGLAILLVLLIVMYGTYTALLVAPQRNRVVRVRIILLIVALHMFCFMVL